MDVPPKPRCDAPAGVCACVGQTFLCAGQPARTTYTAAAATPHMFVCTWSWSEDSAAAANPHMYTSEEFLKYKPHTKARQGRGLAGREKNQVIQ